MNEYGETGLHLASMFGHRRLVSLLLDNNANVNIETVLPTNKTFRDNHGYSGYEI